MSMVSRARRRRRSRRSMASFWAEAAPPPPGFEPHSLSIAYKINTLSLSLALRFLLKKNTLKVLGWVEISLYEDEDLTVYQGLQCGLGFRPV